MRSLERRIDVSAALGVPAPREIAATIHLPDKGDPAPTCLLFAFPGSGYNRRYFDLQWAGATDTYSQAAHHVQRGKPSPHAITSAQATAMAGSRSRWNRSPPPTPSLPPVLLTLWRTARCQQE
jgi:hypothetical protein